MGIMELFELGFFTAFWNWSNPFLTVLVYLFVLIGSLIQLLLQKKCRKIPTRMSLIGICIAGIIFCECVLQTIIGWDRLGIHIVYGLILCVLLGASMTLLGSFLIKKYKQEKII